jgi:hypothetical protein
VQLHPDVLHLRHYALYQLLVLVPLRHLPLVQIDPHDHLLQQVVVQVVLTG